MTFRQAEEYLLGLELFGMRFGLDRMRRLMTVLGLPQRRFESIHVVGTNGKSSTVRFAAAILARHGLRTGSYTSPHLRSFRERIEVGEAPVSEQEFAAAVEQAAHAAALVDRTADPEDLVTQFEALTAAAYQELARREVEVAVVEAGLGGRYDATNVIPSRVQVLTGIDLEHTRWLGPRLEDIAEEKLAVVRDGAHARGAAGPRSGVPRPWPSAWRASAERGSCWPGPAEDTGLDLRAAGGFQRGNFALAAAAAEAFLGRALDPAAVAAAARETRVAGRMDVVGEDPLTVYDGAHNPSGIDALVALARRRPGGAPPARGRDRGAGGQGRRRDAAHAASAVRPGRFHALREPARSLARHAREPGREARTRCDRRGGGRPARRGRARPRRGRSRRRGDRHRIDLPDRRPAARGPRRAGVDAINSVP